MSATIDVPVYAERLKEAAQRIRDVAANATPGPWRDSAADGNRCAALVSDTMPAGRKPEWDVTEGYGGHLVCESMCAGDRAHAALWNPDTAVVVAHVLEYLARFASPERAEFGAALHLADLVLRSEA